MEYIYKILASDDVQKMLLNAIITLLGYATLRISAYINEKVKNDLLKSALLKLTVKSQNFIVNSYKESSESLRKKIQDGNFTDEERKAWKEESLKAMKDQASEEINTLKKLGLDAEATIKQTLESVYKNVVDQLKKN